MNMAKKIVNKTIQIPKELQVSFQNQNLIIKGNFGKVEKKFPPTLKMTLEDHTISINGDITNANTAVAHIKNMINGAQKGYSKKLKVLYAHFPISLTLKDKKIEIKNFLGERIPRFANIVGDTKVEIKGQEIIVSGPSKEDVGQTVANIKLATKIKQYDPRVFQDGIYEIE